MKNSGQTVVLVVFILIALISFIGFNRAHESRIPQIEFVITTWGQTLGGAIAVISALFLLLRAVSGYTLNAMISLTLPFLAGLLIVQFHWSSLIAFAVIVLAVIVQDILKKGAPDPINGEHETQM